MYTQHSPAETQTPAHRKLIGRTAYVIAQQYPSTTFVSMRFH